MNNATLGMENARQGAASYTFNAINSSMIQGARVMKQGQYMPRLEQECLTAAEESKQPTTGELCTICYTSELNEEPSV